MPTNERPSAVISRLNAIPFKTPKTCRVDCVSREFYNPLNRLVNHNKIYVSPEQENAGSIIAADKQKLTMPAYNKQVHSP